MLERRPSCFMFCVQDKHSLRSSSYILHKRTRRFRLGRVAEWLRSGLQIRVLRFDSGRGLHEISHNNFNFIGNLSAIFVNNRCVNEKFQ